MKQRRGWYEKTGKDRFDSKSNISEETNTLKIVTKVRGQKFPDSSYIDLQLPDSDHIYHLQIQYRSMTSSVILEEWVYTIISSDN